MSFGRLFAVLLLLAALPLSAAVVGTVRGVVHDPQHHPLMGASVTLAARESDYKMEVKTNAAGEFSFAAVPMGQYNVTVAFDSLRPSTQTVTVTSNALPVLHFALAIATKSQTIEVTD